MTAVSTIHCSMAPTNPVALVDRRAVTDLHEYSVIMAAKETTWAGHAYVVWVEHPQGGEYRADGIGFYAAGILDGRVLTGSQGQLVEELRQSGSPTGPTSTLVVWVDRKQFVESRRLAREWARDAEYVLMSRDCITFLETVARALGVSLPRRLRILPPNAYLTSLLEHNAVAWSSTTAALSKGTAQ